MHKFLLAFVLAVSALFFSATSIAQDSEMGLAKLKILLIQNSIN